MGRPATDNMTRININIDKGLMNRVDEYATNLSINRTAAVAVLLSNALDTQKSLNSMDELLQILKLKERGSNGGSEK